MTKKKTKRKLKKLKIKIKWNGTQSAQNMKTMRRKKSQTMVKDTEPKDQAKGSTKGGGKKLLRSHI